MNKQEHAFSRGLFYILACLLLAACGSGGDEQVPLTGVSTYQLTNTLGSSSIAPSGSTTITIALKDANGNAASGQQVQLSKTGGASLSTSTVTTDAMGTATATLSGNSATTGTGGVVTATYTDSKGSIASKSAGYSILETENVILTLSKSSVNSGSGDNVALTGVVIDSNGNVVAGKAITFSVSGGFANGTITQSGSASASYLPSTTDLSNKTVTVNASVTGSTATSSATINVIGTTLQLTSPTLATTLGTTVTLQGSLKDGNGNGIGNTNVLLSSPNLPGGSQTITTLSNGNFPAGITATLTSATAGIAKFTATALGATSTLNIAVSGTSFSITAPTANAEIAVNTATPVTLTYLNSGSPVAGTQIYFSSSLGTITGTNPATTDGSGKASVSISSATAGQAIISANTAGGTLLASQTVLFTSSTPNSISVQAGQTGLVSGAQTPITATVLDAASNPVKGKVVVFSVIADPSNGPGLSASTAITDASGKASVSYTAGPQTTATNAVQIKAAVQGTAIETQAPPAAPSHALLTVGGSALFVSITAGNTINNVNPTTYSLPHGVVVTDSSGNPVSNKTITLSVIPTYYYKGFWAKADPVTGIAYTDWTAYQTVSGGCINEDLDTDGIIDPGEDTNGNGLLTPGNPVTLSSASITTNAQGIGTFSVIYGENYAGWLKIRLKATASVSGTESVAQLIYILPASAEDVDPTKPPPALGTSPFGIGTSCSDPD